MTHSEIPENPTSRIGEMSDDMSRKITACYLNLVRESRQEKEAYNNAVICLLTQRVIQSAESILRSADAKDL